MRYQVSIIGKTTIIADTLSTFRMVVSEQKDVNVKPGTAYCLGTLYVVKGGFVPAKSLVFAAVDKADRLLQDADLDIIKAAVDFYFLTLLNTELYVKEFPKDSALFAEETNRTHGQTPIAA